MGCCLAKPNARPATGHRRQNLHHNTPTQESSTTTVADRAPPPSLEEESVKEVLSETPLPKPHKEANAAVHDGGETQKMAVVQEVEKLERVVQEVSRSQISEMCSISEVSVSQVSEMCSAADSYSTATTFTEKRDDEVVSKPSGEPGEVGQRVTRSPGKVPRKRPHSGEIGGGRERVHKSPARRAQATPESKVPAAARTGRAAAQSRSWQQNAGSNGVRRDPGEASGRRSKSPVTRSAGGVGRGSTGRSPMKKPRKPIEQSESEKQSKEEKEEEEEEGPQQQGNESIENPHVSPECFIFL